MKKIKQLLSLALMVCTLSVAAQSTITGTVVDGGQQAPLPGDTIVEKGTSNGVSSDFDGNFTITSSSKLFSYGSQHIYQFCEGLA